ncbi:MAG: SDR family oxidoreductase [Proteobacteria bacterium]|nr:SDR family oxidoreductase [Pseudomonadota bacterium]
MAGKKGLVMGVANDRSIAWGIAKAVHNQGAELAFSFQGDALKKRVEPLADSLGSDFVVPCDVTEPSSMDAVFAAVKERWGELDFLVHAIAFSDKDELKGQYIDTTPDNFASTMNISCYSFTALCQRARPLMTGGGSLLTLTYFGAERVMPHYNVMGVAKAALEASVRYLAVDLGPAGIRVNALSAGPMRTLAPDGVDDITMVWVVPERMDAQPVEKLAASTTRVVNIATVFFILRSFHVPGWLLTLRASSRWFSAVFSALHWPPYARQNRVGLNHLFGSSLLLCRREAG